MTEEKNETEFDSELNHRLIISSLVFTVLATVVTGYLLWATTGDRELLGCGPRSGCHDVLSSRWAYWLDRPVSLPALCFYLVFAYLLFGVRDLRIDPAWLSFITPGAIAAGLVMLWFAGLQAIVIKSFCVFCLASHGLALIAIACLVIYTVRISSLKMVAPWIVSLVLAAGFIATHIIVVPTRIAITRADHGPEFPLAPPTPTAETEPPKPVYTGPTRMVSLHEGKIKFNIYRFPHIGPTDAESVIVKLFDYTCKHCRSLHPQLNRALERYEGRLAIVPMPMPMDAACNPLLISTQPAHENACEYAMYSMAVCVADSSKFEAYHEWLMRGKEPPTVSQARSEASALVGPAAFEAALKNDSLEAWSADARSLYVFAGAGGIPKLFIGDQIVQIAHISDEDLFELLEGALSPKADAPEG